MIFRDGLLMASERQRWRPAPPVHVLLAVEVTSGPQTFSST